MQRFQSLAIGFLWCSDQKRCSWHEGEYGWEIDHIIPEAKGGSDDISNLQPLQWENNRAKRDGVEIPEVIAVNGRNVNALYSRILFE